MRVVLISKALVVGAYQAKAEEIARLGIDLTVLTPPSWRDRRGAQQAERLHTFGYELRTIPLLFNGAYHLHFYPTLVRELRELRPQVVHLDEEPYNLATLLGVRAARSVGAKPLFFTWQNLHRRYPPPFNWFERIVYRACSVALAGNAEARDVLVRKGYQGKIVVLPQFGVDPTIFRPDEENESRAESEEERGERNDVVSHATVGDKTPKDRAMPSRSSPLTPHPSPFHIGYAGGLLPEKGLDLLLRACAGLVGVWRLTLMGSGEQLEALRKLAADTGIAARVTLGVKLPSAEMPDFYRSLDLLVLPSRTRPNWKEQFGRVLIEAMACGVPVLGSDSGEIPHVIGDAGVIFPEGDVEMLRSQLQRLMVDGPTRNGLAAAGRQRVLARFTMAEIARQTVAAYTVVAAGR